MAVIGGRDARTAFGAIPPYRSKLLTSTALQAVFLSAFILPASAQPSPNARPSGGQVVAGAATISRSPTATNIDQATNRAAIDWRSFDVGSNQTVAFHQPSPSSMTLNRVTGPDPSAIAGRITANGGIVITNQSGVVFYPGAEVDATSVVVSAPGITNKNFMAGKLAFDQPAKPGATVSNQGTITIKQAGLGALVAPQVRNAGTITAKLGHVVLAGAEAATLDMYGDGLVSIEVTKQVTRAPRGGAALVTNTGTIAADGGTVQLTAAAVDGVVNTLVQSGGRILAHTVGSKTGTITIGGTGGALILEGTLAAIGKTSGAKGGAIEIAGTGGVQLASTARVNASGQAGGGVAAVGTTITRATSGQSVTPKVVARDVRVAKGAQIAADAGRQGNGGIITLLSASDTTLEGQITALGGKDSGNGGAVEVSGKSGVGLTGSVDVSAAHGMLGTILWDPGTLNIVSGPIGCGTADGIVIASNGVLTAGQPTPTSTVSLTNTAIERNLNGNILLQAGSVVNVNAPITLTTPGQSLTIQSGGNLTVSARAPISAAGAVTLEAAFQATAGVLTLNNTVASTGNAVTLRGAAISANSLVSASGTIDISTLGRGGVSVAALTSTSGAINIAGTDITTTNTIASSGGPVNLSGITSVSISGPISSPGGSVSISGGLIFTCAAISATNVGLQTDLLQLGAPVSSSSGTVAIAPFTPGNTLSFDATQQSTPGTLSLSPAVLAQISTNGGTLALGSTNAGGTTTASAITINSPLNITAIANILGLYATGTVTQGAAGDITAATLIGPGPGFTPNGSLSLQNPGNQIGNFGPFVSKGNLALASGQPLVVSGALEAGNGGTVILQSDSIRIPSAVTVPGGTVELAPLTNGHTVSIDTTTPGSNAPTNLSLLTGDLENIHAPGGTLGIGFTDNQGILGGSITISGSLDLASIAGTLDLESLGAITETTGVLLNLGNLTAFAGDRIFLANANSIGTLAFVGAGGSSGATDASIEVDVAGDLIVNSVRNFSCSVASAPITIRAGRNLTVAPNEGTTIASTGPIRLAAGTSDATGGLILNGSAQSSLGGMQLLTASGGMQINSPVIAGSQIGTTGQLLSIRSDGHLAFGPTGALFAGGGAIEIAPATVGEAMTVGGVGTGLSVAPIPIGTGANGTPVLLRLGGIGGDVTGRGAAQAGSITFAANPILSGTPLQTLELDASGPISEQGGAAITNVNFLTGTAGALNLKSSGNQIEALQKFTATAGDLALIDATALTVSGPVQAGNGQTLSLTAPSVNVAGNAGQSGSLLVLPDTTQSPAKGGNILLTTDSLIATGTIQASSGLVAVAPLTQGNVVTFDATQRISPGALSLSPTLLTQISTGGGTLALGSTTAGTSTTASAISINTPMDLTQTAGTLGLYATGLVTQGAGSVVKVATLIGPAPAPGIMPDGSVALSEAGNSVASLGSFATSGDFVLNDASGLAVIGFLGARNLTMNTKENLAIGQSIVGDAVSLTAGGSINEGQLGSVQTHLLNGSATSAAFTGPNTVDALGIFHTTGGFALTDTAPLTVTGPVSDGTFINLRDQSTITLAGDITAPEVGLVANNGSVTQASGTLTAGTLTGSASGVAQFGTAMPGAVSSVETLGSFSIPNGTFSLSDSEPLTVTGPLAARDFSIAAPGQITLSGGTITTMGLPAASQAGPTPANPGSFFLVQPIGGSGSFTQTGVTTIQSLAGTRATVRVDVPSAGRISLNDLVAPSSSIVLGVTSGTATGTIRVGNLLVLGQTGSSNLFGSVQSRVGPAAAAAAAIQPAINANYRLNNCVIASTTCTIAPVLEFQTIARNTPPTTQLPWLPIALMAGDYADLVPQVPSSGRVRPQTLNLRLNFPPVSPGDSNPELVLPNVSGQDY